MPHLYKAILENQPQDKKNIVLADLFAGTGVVSEFFLEKGYDLIINDNLYSNFACYQAWLSNEDFRQEIIDKYVDEFNKIDSTKLENNYFSEIYGGKYYSNNDAKKIGYIREEVERTKPKIQSREYYSLLASLLYAADKAANTVGHFEHFLSSVPRDNIVELRSPLLKQYKSKITTYEEDTNKLAKKIECDIAYIDPPYNARQYVNFYHVLENLARWNKPTEFEGSSMKFKRDELKSVYSRVGALAAMEDLINSLDAKLIVVSYNNTYKAQSTASNNRIPEESLEQLLEQHGRVKKYEIPYKFFNAGKTNFADHKEIIYTCKKVR